MDQPQVAGVAFDEGADRRALATADDQVTLPVPRRSAFADFHGSLVDQPHVFDFVWWLGPPRGAAIQAQDFFFRKIVRDKGVALAQVAGQIEQFVNNESGNGRLKAERELLATALADVQAMAASLTGYLMSTQKDPKNVYKVGLGSVRFLLSVGDLVIGWLLQQHAAVAIAKLDAGASGDDRAFYEGKIAVASFFANNVLPLLTSTRLVLEILDNEVMKLDEATF